MFFKFLLSISLGLATSTTFAQSSSPEVQQNSKIVSPVQFFMNQLEKDRACSGLRTGEAIEVSDSPYMTLQFDNSFMNNIDHQVAVLEIKDKENDVSVQFPEIGSSFGLLQIYRNAEGPGCVEQHEACRQKVNNVLGKLIETQKKSKLDGARNALECSIRLLNGWRDQFLYNPELIKLSQSKEYQEIYSTIGLFVGRLSDGDAKRVADLVSKRQIDENRFISSYKTNHNLEQSIKESAIH